MKFILEFVADIILSHENIFHRNFVLCHGSFFRGKYLGRGVVFFFASLSLCVQSIGEQL